MRFDHDNDTILEAGDWEKVDEVKIERWPGQCYHAENFFRDHAIRLNRGKLFDISVSPKRPEFDFDRIEGMLLGVAIGDSLGITTEGMLPARRRMEHGELRDYIPNRNVQEARGFPSDDTQLTFWTLEQLIQDKGFLPVNLAQKFSNGGRIFGLGSTMREFLANFKSGKSWHESGPESAGNGALMRIAPIIVPHLRSGGTAIWSDTALSAMLTHNDYASTSTCLAFVDNSLRWERKQSKNPADPDELYDRYTDFGDSPVTRPDANPSFSAWEYAKVRCIEICQEPL